MNTSELKTSYRYLDFAAALIVTLCLLAPSILWAKTVCTVTINSEHEKHAFQDYLGPLGYKFVELAEEHADDDSTSTWFRRACERGIECDILVVSGHFGGSFFGETGLQLPMEELERASCNSKCDGLLKKPREVFLFGCNTLAGKEKDRRTPREYRQVLISDGFAPEQAARMTAFRYSPIGSSFQARMSRVFPKTPRIYGFNSIGPSGLSIDTWLRSYLEDAVRSGYYSTDNIGPVTPTRNNLFFRHLRQTAIRQTPGTSTRAPVCFLESPSTKTLEKLNWIRNALNFSQRLQYIPEIKDFLSALDIQGLTGEEREVYQSIRANKSISAQLAPFIRRPQPGLLATQLGVANLMRTLAWIGEDAYDRTVKNLILGDLSKPLTIARADEICSAHANVDHINEASIPADRWSDPQFLRALTCLKPRNEGVRRALAVRVTAPPRGTQLWTVRALGETGTQDEAAHFALWKLMTETSSEKLRVAALEALIKIQPVGARFQTVLMESVNQRGTFEEQAMQILAAVRPVSADLRAFFARASSHRNSEIRKLATEALGTNY